MIGMNGFTLGFFFPKQDVSKASHPSDKQEAVKQVKSKDTAYRALDDSGEYEEPSLFLHAYRYF